MGLRLEPKLFAPATHTCTSKSWVSILAGTFRSEKFCNPTRGLQTKDFRGNYDATMTVVQRCATMMATVILMFLGANMVRVTLGLVLAPVFAMRLLAAENAVEEHWQTYIDDTYKVSLRFPGEWSRDALIYQDRPYFSSERKPHSVIHSFQLELMGDEGTTPEQVCKGEVEHVLKPFGAKPTIQLKEIDGSSACIVFPSDEVGAPWYAAAFIKYPEPVEIEGDRYSILALYADKAYFREMVESLHFISLGHRNPPFLLTIAAAHLGTSGATWKNEYSVQVERDLPPELGKGLVESNTITVTVIDSKEVH